MPHTRCLLELSMLTGVPQPCLSHAAYTHLPLSLSPDLQHVAQQPTRRRFPLWTECIGIDSTGNGVGSVRYDNTVATSASAFPSPSLEFLLGEWPQRRDSFPRQSSRQTSRLKARSDSDEKFSPGRPIVLLRLPSESVTGRSIIHGVWSLCARSWSGSVLACYVRSGP